MTLRLPATAILTVSLLAAVSASPARAVDCNKLAADLVSQYGLVKRYYDGEIAVAVRSGQLQTQLQNDQTELASCNALYQKQGVYRQSQTCAQLSWQVDMDQAALAQSNAAYQNLSASYEQVNAPYQQQERDYYRQCKTTAIYGSQSGPSYSGMPQRTIQPVDDEGRPVPVNPPNYGQPAATQPSSGAPVDNGPYYGQPAAAEPIAQPADTSTQEAIGTIVNLIGSGLARGGGRGGANWGSGGGRQSTARGGTSSAMQEPCK